MGGGIGAVWMPDGGLDEWGMGWFCCCDGRPISRHCHPGHSIFNVSLPAMAMFTWMALLLRRTLDSIATPCSVKAKGRYLRPPRPCIEVPIWNLIAASSSFESRNMKSAGKRSLFLANFIISNNFHLFHLSHREAKSIPLLYLQQEARPIPAPQQSLPH